MKTDTGKQNPGVEGAASVSAFRVNLVLIKMGFKQTGEKKQAYKPELKGGQFETEFEISNLPLPVKKHIIAAGIVQGQIFEFSDTFAHIKESNEKVSGGRHIYLCIRGPSKDALFVAIEVLEHLIEEALHPESSLSHGKKPVAKTWRYPCQKKYEIQDLPLAVVSKLITQGIILGELYKASGAVVCTRGSPLVLEGKVCLPPGQQPLYLFFQGPTAHSINVAVQWLEKLVADSGHPVNKPILAQQQTNRVEQPATGVEQPATRVEEAETPQPEETKQALANVLHQLQQCLQTQISEELSAFRRSNADLFDRPKARAPTSLSELLGVTKLTPVPEAQQDEGNVLSVGTWNVKDCSDPDKQIVINQTLNNAGVHVAVLQETGGGRSQRVATEHYAWWCAKPSARTVAILLRRDSGCTLSNFHPYSDCVASADLSFSGRNFKIIGCYLPDSSDPAYLGVVSDLLLALKKESSSTHTMLLGDFNAHVGFSDLSKTEKKYFGERLLHQTCNTNGVLLKRLAVLHNLFAISTHVVADKNSHITCKLPVRCQLDYIFFEFTEKERPYKLMWADPSNKNKIVWSDISCHALLISKFSCSRNRKQRPLMKSFK